MYQKTQSHEVTFLRYGVRQTEFFVILGHFLSFYSPKNQENQNFEKMKKASGDVIILHMCYKILGVGFQSLAHHLTQDLKTDYFS